MERTVCQVGKRTVTWNFMKHELLERPSPSPDLNIIENLKHTVLRRWLTDISDGEKFCEWVKVY